METVSSFIPVLAGAMLFSGFMLSSRMRLFSLIVWFRIQAVLLALYAGALGMLLADGALYASAFFVFAIKAVLVPFLLGRAAARRGVSQKLDAYIRPALLAFLAALIIGGAFAAAHAYPLPQADLTVVAAALALVLIGFLLLITRKDLFGQVVGFLMLENGIFMFGLALVHGMPLLLEIGISFDVLIGFILMTALLNRAHREHASVHTDRFRELVG